MAIKEWKVDAFTWQSRDSRSAVSKAKWGVVLPRVLGAVARNGSEMSRNFGPSRGREAGESSLGSNTERRGDRVLTYATVRHRCRLLPHTIGCLPRVERAGPKGARCSGQDSHRFFRQGLRRT